MTSRSRLAVVLLSGGLDSMVAAGLARESGFQLVALTIEYGQRHSREVEAAGKIAENLGIDRHIIMPVDLACFGGSALTGNGEISKTGLTHEIPKTYVPGRNLVFLSLAASLAEAIGSHNLFIGANAVDYSGYPDCRPEFIESFARTLSLGTKGAIVGKSINVEAPLQNWTKGRIVRECLRLGLDPRLSWSCYDPVGNGKACGRCDSCRLRLKGFAEAGARDPLDYDRIFGELEIN